MTKTTMAKLTEPVMVTATDPTGAPSTVLVTITVNDVNDAPKFAKYAPTATTPQDDNPTVLTVVENTLVLDRDPGDAEAVPTYAATDADAHDAGDGQAADANATPPVVALTYEVTGADKSAFTITLVGDNWTLAFKSDHKVNYEAKDEYSITIVASDDDAPEGVGTVDVTVNVTNAEDDGVVTPTQREPQIGKEVVVRLDDQDGDVRGQKWQWYRNAEADTAEDDLEDLTTTCETSPDVLCLIGGATSPNYTPVEADKDKLLAARVTYTDAYVTDGG